MFLPFLRKVLEGSEFECIKFEFFQKAQLLPIASKFYPFFLFRAQNFFIRMLQCPCAPFEWQKTIYSAWQNTPWFGWLQRYTLSGHQLIVHSCSTKELNGIVAASRRCGKMISNHVKELQAMTGDQPRNKPNVVCSCRNLFDEDMRHRSGQNLVGAWGHIKFLFHHNINLKEDTVFTRKSAAALI